MLTRFLTMMFTDTAYGNQSVTLCMAIVMERWIAPMAQTRQDVHARAMRYRVERAWAASLRSRCAITGRTVLTERTSITVQTPVLLASLG